MLSVIILLWPLLANSCFANSPGCPVTWFGSGCRYKCRCTNDCPPCTGLVCICSQDNCDVHGECQNGVTCQIGWFGPACQYADLAVNATVVAQPDGGQVSELTDGDDTTCLQAHPSVQSVTLTLTQYFYFTWLRVHVSSPALLYSLRVQFIVDSNSITDCFNPRNATVKSTNLDICCEIPDHVHEVVVTGDGVKALCSIYISGGRNVALRENTTQSSTHDNGLALNAVDGNTNGNYSGNSCTHTIPTYSPLVWWDLAFSRTKRISRILVYNRDTFQNRLGEFVLIAETPEYDDIYAPDEDILKDVYTVIFKYEPRLVTSITISAPAWTTDGYILTLCEVEVYGETVCPQGRYGRDCERQCNCDGECFISTGGCPKGCPAGYKGENCKDNCPHQTFGEDCSNNCSKNCSGDGACHTATGACSHGCLPGFDGLTCDQPCSDTFFGSSCKEKCSSDCKGQICDRFNGTCDRCYVGKSGDFCEKDCPQLTFGEDCSNNCSKNCSGDGACQPMIGACSHGCLPGFVGLTCDQRAEARPDVREPSIVIPVAGSVAAFVVVVIIVNTWIVCCRRHKHPRPADVQETSYQEVASQYVNDFSHGEVMYSGVSASVARPPAVESQADSVPCSATRCMEDYYNTIPVQDRSSTTDLNDHYDVISPYDEHAF